ncbi:MAG: hypothetical protein AAB906_03230 [Patescibacteria group bacterium]
MKIKGIKFPYVFMGAGTQNFFGEGWPFHRCYKRIPGFSFNEIAFVSKTATIRERSGNMKLKANLQPESLFPNCIKAYFLEGVMLNAVGLSGPGLDPLLKKGEWQKRVLPFLVSFMAVGDSKGCRLAEAREFASLINEHRHEFITAFGLEVNLSCPNAGHDTEKLTQEASEILEILRKTELPISVKVNALIRPELAKKLADSKMCDAITVSNTIPYGQLPELINWKKMFGAESPLKKYGGGGLSGWPLLPVVANWVKEARNIGIDVPIIAGGGIQKKEDVNILKDAGASAISICSVVVLRPWRVQGIINYANKLYGG